MNPRPTFRCTCHTMAERAASTASPATGAHDASDAGTRVVSKSDEKVLLVQQQIDETTVRSMNNQLSDLLVIRHCALSPTPLMSIQRV